jgi:hypothetical protein
VVGGILADVPDVAAMATIQPEWHKLATDRPLASPAGPSIQIGKRSAYAGFDRS